MIPRVMTCALSYGVRLAFAPLVVACACLAASCGDDGPPVTVTPPPSSSTDAAVPVRETNRLAWNQSAPSYQHLQRYGFTIYVDGQGGPLFGVECIDSVSAGAYPCSARLPQMSPGPHTIQLAAVADGVESARSIGLAIAVASGRTVADAESSRGRNVLAPGDANGAALCATAAICFQAERRVSSLLPISSPAALPDGRLLFVEDGRHIRVLGPDGADAAPAMSLAPGVRAVALLIDPAFSDNGMVRVAWSAGDEGLERTFGIIRVRELDGRFGEPATIVPEMTLPAAGTPRVAQDEAGRIYAALAGSTPNEALRGNGEGRLLRFSAEGLTWSAGLGAPAIAQVYTTPHALVVDRQRGRLWLSGRDAAGVERLASMPFEPSAPHNGTDTTLSSAIVSLAVAGDAPGGESILLVVDAEGRLAWAPHGDVTTRRHLVAGDEQVLAVAASRDGALMTTKSNEAGMPTFSLFTLRFAP